MAQQAKQRTRASASNDASFVSKSKSKASAQKQAANREFANYVAFGIFVYYVAMMYLRYQHRGLYCFLDTAWLCNFNMLIAATGMLMGNPTIIGAPITAVFVIHLLWIVDMITYFINGTFPVGLAAYMAWPETSVGEQITSTHHVWFIPLCIYTMYKLQGRYILKCWLIAVVLISPVLFASLLSPEEIILENGEPYYLNINLAHGWWKDVNSWPFSLIPKENPGYFIVLHLIVLAKISVGYVVLNFITKFMLKNKKE